MAEKKYSLTKNESDRLGNLLSVARIQEEMLNAITLTYKTFLTEQVFKRCGVDPKDFAKTMVNLETGELIIKEEPTPVTRVEAKGESK